MPNDDLGQFPTPSKPSLPTTDTPSVPYTSTSNMDNSQNLAPTPPQPISTFEETPEVIPSVYNQPNTESPIPPVSSVAADIPSPYIPKEVPVEVVPQTPVNPAPPINQPIPATLPSSSAPNMSTVVFAFIFIVAVVAIAGAAFLFQQSQSLKNQLAEITKTVEKQQTAPETTPTPTLVEVPLTSPTATPSAKPSVSPATTISATPTPTQIIVSGSPMKPLSIASNILQIAIKHSPNAQLILVKTENANDPTKATSKYFFRQDLTTKKYFYVLVSAGSNPEVVDKQIYVTPDDNIPSLNDSVLQNSMGIDLNDAITITYANCATQEVCTSSSAKAQYIKTTAGVIWQISLTAQGKTEPMVIQINATTKAVLFKTADFGK